MARSRPARPVRHRALAPVAVVLGLALSGCSATNQVTTTLDYDPSDGVSVSLGEVHVGNLILLTAEEGAPGTLVGFVANRGGEDATVTLDLGDGGTEIDVPGNATVLLGPEGDETVEVASSPAPPGSKTPLTATSDAAGSVQADIPVLDGTLPEYADLVPDASTD